MQLPFVCLLLLTIACYVHAKAQFDYFYRMQQPNYFRAGFPQPSYDVQQPKINLSRYFTSLTFTVTTSTTTTTLTTTYTCTTSTAAISYCTPSGRRRRRSIPFNDDKEGRGLFYNDEDMEKEDGSIFLPSPVT